MGLPGGIVVGGGGGSGGPGAGLPDWMVATDGDPNDLLLDLAQLRIKSAFTHAEDDTVISITDADDGQVMFVGSGGDLSLTGTDGARFDVDTEGRVSGEQQTTGRAFSILNNTILALLQGEDFEVLRVRDHEEQILQLNDPATGTEIIRVGLENGGTGTPGIHLFQRDGNVGVSILRFDAAETEDLLRITDEDSNPLLRVGADGTIIQGGFFGVTPVTVQPVEPTTLNEVIDVLQAWGLAA